MLTSITIRAKDLFWLKLSRAELMDWCIKVFRLNQLVVERNVLPSAPVVRIGSDQNFLTSGGYACPYLQIPDTEPDVAYFMYPIAEVLDLGWGEDSFNNAKVYVIFRDTVRAFAQSDIINRYVEFRETSSEYDLDVVNAVVGDVGRQVALAGAVVSLVVAWNRSEVAARDELGIGIVELGDDLLLAQPVVEEPDADAESLRNLANDVVAVGFEKVLCGLNLGSLKENLRLERLGLLVLLGPRSGGDCGIGEVRKGRSLLESCDFFACFSKGFDQTNF
jgi:hypothetical protein